MCLVKSGLGFRVLVFSVTKLNSCLTRIMYMYTIIALSVFNKEAMQDGMKGST